MYVVCGSGVVGCLDGDGVVACVDGGGVVCVDGCVVVG